MSLEIMGLSVASLEIMGLSVALIVAGLFVLLIALMMRLSGH